VPCSAYRTVREVMADEHFRLRGTFATVHDAAGAFLAQNLPFKMSGAPTASGSRVAALGEDTESVLRQFAGHGHGLPAGADS
jgi:crotonobetainyl-CoA:carnitine CoA-transferase CaiB-like acyl-CoA transferase